MKRTSKAPVIKTLFVNTRDNTCDGVENISIIVHKRRLHHRKKSKRVNEACKQMMGVPLTNNILRNNSSKLSKRSSMPEFTKKDKAVKLKVSTSETTVNKSHNPFSSKYFVNVVSECRQAECLNPFNNPLSNIKWRVYRCQLSTQDDSCCCSCNSDAMFEVMKSLYDCYKKKNCDHCNCILCGHLPREERKLGELRKSGAALSSVGVGTQKEKAEMAKKTKKAEKELVGKSPAEKEKILKELAMSGAPLPQGKTASEKELIKKVRAEFPVASKEKLKKAETAKLMIPLEGKTAAEKEKILLDQAKAGIPLPEGKTASEKAIIQKVKATVGVPSKGVPSEKLRKAKAAGFLTPLEGKTPEQKEKILRGLATSGVPLPEAKTASEKKLIDKVRTEMGLPPEPKTSAEKKKYQKALASGIVTPLEGKSKAQKEKILKSQAEAGLPLPEGRTPSEKALVAKVKAETVKAPSAVAVPSEKLRKAKAAGFLTPLEGKTPEQKEKILKGLAVSGVPLPEGKTASEKKLIDKVRTEVGLPPEPKTSAEKKKYQKALASGIITPLEGKSKAQKEKILKSQAEAGLPLPEGRTPSEKALVAKVKAETVKAPSAVAVPSEKLRKAKAAGFLTPLEGKTPEQKEKILKGLAVSGVPLPEGKTASEKKLIDKVRTEVGLPPEPKTSAEKKKYQKALASGIITPLEGKSKAQKEKILKSQAEAGLPLPEGRTPSEKALVAKVKAETVKAPSAVAVPSEKLRKAKAAGLLTPLEGKTPEQKEKILKGLAVSGVPLPEGKTASEKKLIDKVRTEVGLPPEPKTSAEKKKYQQALASGIITPLEGKSKAQKEKILKSQAEAGLPLPEGRTPSEKALVAKVKAETVKAPSAVAVPSEKLRKAKAAGFLTPLEGKTPEQKEKILKGLAVSGVPLPEGKTASEKKLIDKVRTEVGLPPEPKTSAEKKKYQKALASGIITPLEGKSKAQKEKILKSQAEAGLPLPEGRTPSEKALIGKIKATTKPPSEGAPSRKVAASPSEKLRKAKAAGLITPIEGKSPEQKEKILRGLAMQGLPLPEGKTASEKKLIDKVRYDVGLPAEPKVAADKEKYKQAIASGVITPLEGKNAAQKEKILKAQFEAGLPLPEGRTASEKALIQKVKAEAGEKKRTKSKAIGAGVPALPPEEARKLDEKTAKVMKEGKGPCDECICGLLTPESERVSVGKAVALKTPSGAPSVAKIPSEKLRKAKAAGLLTPLAGKPPEQREKILKGLAKAGLPLPEGKTASEKKIIDKVRADLGIPPEPKTPSMKQKYARAQTQGIMTPLEGKTPAQKEKILKSQAEAGLPLPEGRTPSEKALIGKIKATTKPLSEKALSRKVAASPSEKLRKAKAAGLITPLEGKSPEQKEKILRGLAMQGLPLPEGKTASEKKLIDKVRHDVGLPQEPKATADKEKYKKAITAGIITPLEGKTAAQKEKILKAQVDAGLPLPEGRTASDKSLIKKVRAGVSSAARIPSEKLRKAKEAGLLTPLAGKPPEQREKILKGLAKAGLPLPEGKTASEKKIIDKVRADLGIPPEPKTPSMKQKYARAQTQGIMTPLEGKTPAQKEKILKSQAEAGLPLPEGRTPSEKAIISKVRATTVPKLPSEKLREAKAAGLLTPLEGKSKDQKEKIIKGLVKAHLPLPEGKTPSDKELIRKIRDDMRLPPEPKTPSIKEKYQKALAAGVITPLEGKTPAQKEKILKQLKEAGIPLPEGKTASEKSLVRKVKAAAPSKVRVPSEKLMAAKAAGLLTPLEGKTPAQKEKILKGLAQAGIPLPEGKTASEKALIRKTQAELGIKSPRKGPPTPLSKEAQALDKKTTKFMTEGKGPSDECICDILTPESEKFSVGKLGKLPSEKAERVPSEKLRKAKAAGLLTPLEGKSAAQKEKIMKGLAESGLPLPEPKTASEKALVQKVKTEYGIPKAVTPSEKEIVRKAKAEGLFTPLTGKSAAQKEKKLKGLVEAGLPLPEGKTASEKQLIQKVRTAAGLPPEATPSEKLGKIRTKSKKVGAAASKRMSKGIGGTGVTKAGIAEEFEDVLKTTMCDRGCGCDKKKIRFKHSYVKIRVTSPDISSLCPCPDECVPGVKGGVFVDNEGIKVTVGSAVGFPKFSTESKVSNHDDSSLATSSSEFNHISPNEISSISEIYFKRENDFKIAYKNKNMNANYSNESLSIIEGQNNIYKDNIQNYSDNDLDIHYDKDDTSTSRYLIACSESCFSTSNPESQTELQDTFCDKSSLNSVVIVRTESSLSFSTKLSTSIRTISIISLHNSRIDSTSSHYVCYECSRSVTSVSAEGSEHFTNVIDYSTMDSLASNSKEVIKYSVPVEDVIPDTKSPNKIKGYNDAHIYRISHSNLRFNCKKTSRSIKDPHQPRDGDKHDPIIVINDLNSDDDILQIVSEILAKKNIANSSSIFVVVPTPDEYDTDLTESVSSTICIRVSQNFFGWKNSRANVKSTQSSKKAPAPQGLKITARAKNLIWKINPTTSKVKLNQKQSPQTTFDLSTQNKNCQADNMGKQFCLVCTPTHSVDFNVNQKHSAQTAFELSARNKDCQVDNVVKQLFSDCTPTYSKFPIQPHQNQSNQTAFELLTLNQHSQVESKHILEKREARRRGFNMDTTQDRPCCCQPKEPDFPNVHGSNEQFVANAFSEIMMPMILKQGTSQGFNEDAYLEVPRLDLSGFKTNFSLNQSTSISTCKVPPCSKNYPHCHEYDMNPIPHSVGTQSFQYPDLGGMHKITPIKSPCKCMGRMTGTRTQSMPTQSVGCGPNTCKNPNTTIPIHNNQGVDEAYPCSTCGRPTMKDGRQISCLCSGKEQKIQMPSLCPCEGHKPAVTYTAIGSSDQQTKSVDDKATITSNRNACVCSDGSKGKKSKKNVICECPEIVEEEPEIDRYFLQDDYSDAKADRKMKSDQTQTTSGFRINFKKRPPLTEEMSFEDALKYYEEHPEEDIGTQMDDSCVCNKSGAHVLVDNPDVQCECPYEAIEEPEAMPEPELPGLKIHIGGKGSGSKGLSGICCFDMVQESNGLLLLHD